MQGALGSGRDRFSDAEGLGIGALTGSFESTAQDDMVFEFAWKVRQRCCPLASMKQAVPERHVGNVAWHSQVSLRALYLVCIRSPGPWSIRGPEQGHGERDQ